MTLQDDVCEDETRHSYEKRSQTDLINMEIEMDRYICLACDYIYDPEIGDPEGGVAPGTPFEDIPDDWECPLCGVSKDEFDMEI